MVATVETTNGPLLLSPKIKHEYEVLGLDVEGVERSDIDLLLKFAKTEEELLDIARICKWLHDSSYNVKGWTRGAVAYFVERVEYENIPTPCPYPPNLELDCHGFDEAFQITINKDEGEVVEFYLNRLIPRSGGCLYEEIEGFKYRGIWHQFKGRNGDVAITRDSCLLLQPKRPS